VTYQSPGVYIEEVPSGPQPITAASTSVVAVLGTTRKGPVLTPTRVTGWSDFVRIFGPAHSRGFTAESVFGFFENGGPAAWVVRVDPSTSATWNVQDSTPALSFVATSTSPGAWTNGVSLGIAPDFTGGAGTLARATVKTAVTVQAAAIDIAVEATGGIRPGDLVTLVAPDKTKQAKVNTVGAGTINVSKTTAADIGLNPGDTVAVRTDPASSTITLAAGTGIKAGDLLVIQAGDGSRQAALVASVVSAGASLAITLGSAAPAVDGVTFAPRFATFGGQITGGTAAFGLSDITWDLPDSVVPHTADNQLTNARATLSNGVEAAFSGATFAVPGGAASAAGRVSVAAQLRVQVFSEAIDLTPGSVGGVLGVFGFLPVGTAVKLSKTTAPTKTATVTRTGSGTGDTDGTAAGDPLTTTFDLAEFVLPDDTSKGVVVRCAVPPSVGDYVAFGSTKVVRITGVNSPGGNIHVLHFTATTDISGSTNADPGRFPVMTMASTQFLPQRFTLTVQDGAAVVETFKGLALDPAHPQYFAKDDIVNGVSAYVTLARRTDAAPAISITSMPAFAVASSPGTDKPATNQSFRDGLTALETQPEPAMVICPDAVTLGDPLLQADLVGQVVTHCETFRRFAIIDGPDEDDDVALLAWRNTNLASTYAAMYAPHLQIITIDPDSIDRFTVVPPSGFVAGVFARTDRDRGVHKAPGNERVTGIVGLRQSYTQRRQDLLNPGSVNLIRAFPGRGARIWGARNATDDTVWRYVNVRRLFNMIETSVEAGTQWVVFEPNTAQTWIRVKASVENFLDQQWRAGALAGAKPEEAYRVRVGLGQTMSETDIDLGLIITEVAIAPAKPAEFVVFRFSHKQLSE
jgi:phage tail sheath protein FI